MTKLFLLAVALSGCGAVGAPNFSGTWRYSWEVRPGLWWHGAMSLDDTGGAVTGGLGYPDEDPAAEYGDPAIGDGWPWAVSGEAWPLVDLRVTPVAPVTTSWRFLLSPETLQGGAYAGECCEAAGYVLKGGFGLVTP